jgi:hypothetical protein
MAFTGNFMCTSFKKELLEAVHNFQLSGGDTFKIAPPLRLRPLRTLQPTRYPELIMWLAATR